MKISRTAMAIGVPLGALVLLTETAQSVDPPRRAHHALVYDESRQTVLLTAGSTPIDGGQHFQFFNDLWSFDGSEWRLLAESGERVSGIGLAYELPRHQVVSFGGYNGSSIADLRVLVGDQWELRGPYKVMRVAEPGFVYDTRRSRFVAFGGSMGPGQVVGDTWEYDSAEWARVPTASPPPRQAHAMVFDRQRERTVVFGGMGLASPDDPRPSLSDTWEYDGKGWKQREVTGPSPRHSPSSRIPRPAIPPLAPHPFPP